MRRAFSLPLLDGFLTETTLNRVDHCGVFLSGRRTRYDRRAAVADVFSEIWEKQRLEHNARVEAQRKLMASEAYQSELKFIGRMKFDVIRVLQLCLAYSSRDSEFSENSIVVRSTDDLAQSIMAVWRLAQDGLIAPIKRELRYVLESVVKHLYVDQQMWSRNPTPTLAERLTFLHDNVDPSKIDVRDLLKLEALHPDDAKQLIDELYDTYRDCCAYVHVSRRQIEERLELALKDRSLGFETPEELRKIGRLMFRTFDIALALYFHGYGLTMSGDIFIEVLDDLPEWKFHKGKYVGVVSAYFDYKHERNMRKYGEARPWSAVGWPPKRL
jgi:hypothetical protein